MSPDKTPQISLVTQGRGLRRHLSPDIVAAALLLLATVTALVWANSPWGNTYTSFWNTQIAVQMGGARLPLSLHHLVNDGLMAFFFFVIGLEVKRELVLGELADRRRAMVPVMGAVMGVVVAALVYLLFNPSGVNDSHIFFINGHRHTGPHDAESLIAALLGTYDNDLGQEV